MKHNRTGSIAQAIAVTATMVGCCSVAGAASATLSRAYNTSGDIKGGSLVSLTSNGSTTVTPANVSNDNRLIGVAVASNDSLLAVGQGASKTQVVSSGSALVMVSTLNGDIAIGDTVAASPFNGIGMKASSQSKVIGAAQSALNAKTQDTTLKEVTDKHRKQTQVRVGYVRVGVAVGSNASGATAQSPGVKGVIDSAVGRRVPTFRLILSTILVMIALGAVATLLYSSVKSSISAIGRNPLARYAVFKALFNVLATITAVAVVTSVSVYLLLR